MNQSVKFTIITITYNAAQWLERTILSILSQSYGNIEYVIIDGASTDGTVDIIRQYAPGVSFWLSEPDKGLYDAMNKGLQHATGDYVWFINAEAETFAGCYLWRDGYCRCTREDVGDASPASTQKAFVEEFSYGNAGLPPVFYCPAGNCSFV